MNITVRLLRFVADELRFGAENGRLNGAVRFDSEEQEVLNDAADALDDAADMLEFDR